MLPRLDRRERPAASCVAGVIAITISAAACYTGELHKRPLSAPSTVTGVSTSDPLTGADLRLIHAHGHEELLVRGRVVSRDPAGKDLPVAPVQVLACDLGVLDPAACHPSTIRVDADGTFESTLIVSWDSARDVVHYNPSSLLFLARECRATRVPVEEDTQW